MTNAEADALAMGVTLTLIEAKESEEFSFPVVVAMTDSTGYEFIVYMWDGGVDVPDPTIGDKPPDWRRISLPITVEVTDASENCYTIKVTQTDINRTLAVARKALQ